MYIDWKCVTYYYVTLIIVGTTYFGYEKEKSRVRKVQICP